MKKRYSINFAKFECPSVMPLAVRIRLALEEQGMQFENAGKFSSISQDRKPLGEVTYWEDHRYPGKRFFEQTLSD